MSRIPGGRDMLKRSLIFFLAAAASFIECPVVWSFLNADLRLKTAEAALSPSVPSKMATPESLKLAHEPNQTTTKILGLDQAKHLPFWTLVVKIKKQVCDVVVRATFEGGTESGVDTWKIGCRDGNEYSINISPDAHRSVCTRKAFADTAE